MLALLALTLTGILEPKEALSGFSSEPAIIVAAVFVFRMFTYLGPILIGGVCMALLSRRFRRPAAGSVS